MEPLRSCMMAGMKWLTVVFLVASCALPQDLDVLIRGGRLVDGTGNPWRMADVGIRGGKIVAVGTLGAQRAAKVIDAKNLVVAPGFIDIHNHSDDTVLTDGDAHSMVRQGVTSMIFGEGGSAAPSARFPDFNSYFAELIKRGVSTNIGSYVGSSQIWTQVRGPKAGPTTPEELDRMRAHVRTAMRQGALGVSSSLSGPPGSWIDTDTLIAMCQVAAEHGGIYSTHMRTEGQGVFESVAEALEIGRRAGLPVDIIHLKIADHKLWGRMSELIGTIRQARENGQQVEAHVYPYRAGQNNLSSIIPPWAHEGGTDAMLARLRDPAQRARIREQVENGIPGTNWYNHYTATGSWEGMLLVSLANPAYKKFEGKRMSEVVKALGADGIDALFQVLLDNRGSVPTIYFHHSEDDMRYALRQPFVSIGSDGTAVKTEGPLARGNPHPRYYGTFPRVLGRYVREDKVLTLEEAVRKMTSANAAKIGIYDRGLIRPGMWADVTVFNPATVIDNSDWNKPHQYATGIEHVLVNGEVVLAEGRHTGARPGQILKGAGATATPVGKNDRAAAEWIIRNGGNVRLVNGTKRIDSLADLPQTSFRISSVDLIGTTIDPAELGRLSELDELTELFLPGPIFNPGAGSRLDANDQLKALAGLRKLERLHFSLHFLTNINVQDKGLAHLKDLTGLQELRLTQGRVKGPGLAPFVNLRKLDLNYSAFGDEGMPFIGRMRGLRELALRDTYVTDAGLAHLAGLAELESLDLYGGRFTDSGIRHLAGLKKLKRLNLLGSTISDDGVALLAGLSELRELNLYRTQISNTGLAKLARLKSLRSLDVRYTRVSRGGIDEFRRLLPGARIEFQDSSPQTGSAALRQSAPASASQQDIAAWVTRMGGRASVRNGVVAEIDLSRTAVTDRQIAHLKPLTSLLSLNLDTTEIGDLGAAELASLPSLQELNLSHTLLSDRGVAALARLPKLNQLRVAHTLVETVTELPDVEVLSFAGCSIRDESIARIAGLKRLRDLDLSYTDITDAGVGRLGVLTDLQRLDLTATEIGDEGLKHLAGLTRLQHLRLNYGRFTDKGVAALAGLRSLSTLEVARSRVTDSSVDTLAALPGLRHLNLDYTAISDAGVAKLAAARPELESLRLDTANLTDAAIEPLLTLRRLAELNLYHTLITPAGYERLKAGLPNCRIVYDADSALPTRRKS
jgi:N-acyl-D-amino-acid deacylase